MISDVIFGVILVKQILVPAIEKIVDVIEMPREITDLRSTTQRNFLVKCMIMIIIVAISLRGIINILEVLILRSPPVSRVQVA